MLLANGSNCYRNTDHCSKIDKFGEDFNIQYRIWYDDWTIGKDRKQPINTQYTFLLLLLKELLHWSILSTLTSTLLASIHIHKIYDSVYIITIGKETEYNSQHYF